MALLSREAILAASDLPSEIVPVPEWGGDVRVLGMTVKERSAYESGFTKEVKDKNGAPSVSQDRNALKELRERLFAHTVVDEKGNRLFNDGDYDALSKKSAAAMERVLDAARRVCGMSQADLDEMGNASSETEDAGSSSD